MIWAPDLRMWTFLSSMVRQLQQNSTAYAFNRQAYYMALRAGKMTQIARCDWLPERARWSHLARSRLPVVSRKKNFPESHIINPLLTKFVRSRWLDIGLDIGSFFASLWTSTSSQSITTQKKELGQYRAILTSHLVKNPYK